MRFLADESCDFSVVQALRAAGHDVAAVAEIARGADDAAVIDLARSAQRVLITEDKDFGHLVFAATRQASGVIFLRFPQGVRASLVPAVLELVSSRGEALLGCFVVVEPGQFRITQLP
jgi:predicted nuclease of predicted toxin-antitoxin system